jgi:hypothetical protein
MIFVIETDIVYLHQVLLAHKEKISSRILTLPQTYRLQLKNLLDHLITINEDNYKINFRESYIFTNPTEIEDDNNVAKLKENDSIEHSLFNNDETLLKNDNIESTLGGQTVADLRKTANPQQKYLLEFLQNYFDHLLKHSRRPSHVTKPNPFHIVVNGLAGSGKSYVISIIEKMLQEYCITESAGVSHARKNCGLLKMAHTGKAALNIRGSTIHSALEIVKKLHLTLLPYNLYYSSI